MVYDFELKENDIDTVGWILKKNDNAMDLTGCTVSFTLKNKTDLTKMNINCTLGGYIDGTYYNASAGGVSVPFGALNTSSDGEYDGEFIVTDTNSNTIHIPSGDDYISIMIWPAL